MLKHNLTTINQKIETAISDLAQAPIDDVKVLNEIHYEVSKAIEELEQRKPVLPDLIACSRRTIIRNRDYLQGFERGFQQAKDAVLGVSK